MRVPVTITPALVSCDLQKESSGQALPIGHCVRQELPAQGFVMLHVFVPPGVDVADGGGEKELIFRLNETRFGLMVLSMTHAPIARRRPIRAFCIFLIPSCFEPILSEPMYSMPPIVIMMTARAAAISMAKVNIAGRYVPRPDTLFPPDVIPGSGANGT